MHLLRRTPANDMLIRRMPYQNLPSRRNPSFFGRDAELDILSSVLRPRDPPTKLSVCCLYGLAGAGKTQLALEFANRYLDDYEAVLWVSANTPAKLSESFTALARGIGLADPSIQHPDQLKDAVKRWLIKTSRTSMETPKSSCFRISVETLPSLGTVANIQSIVRSRWPVGTLASHLRQCKRTKCDRSILATGIPRFHYHHQSVCRLGLPLPGHFR